MKLDDIEPGYMVFRSEEVAKLEKLAKEMPIEIQDPIINGSNIHGSNIRDLMIELDRTSDYDLIVHLDFYQERACTAGALGEFYKEYLKVQNFPEAEDVRKSLDKELLRRIISPVREDVRIEEDALGCVVSYDDGNQKRRALIKFWDGCS